MRKLLLSLGFTVLALTGCGGTTDDSYSDDSSDYVSDTDRTDGLDTGVDNMEVTMNQAEAIFDLVEIAYVNSSFDSVYEIDTDYTNLQRDVDEHSGANVPDMNETFATDYEGFYNTIYLDFLPLVNQASLDMHSGDSEAFDTDYTNLLDSYNSLIDSYNSFLDETGY